MGLQPASYNIIVVCMIPGLIEIPTAPWKVLPGGVHTSDLRGIAESFAFNPQRRYLFDRLVEASSHLAYAGCRTIYVDGSYVTSKPIPADYDVCWDPEGVAPLRLHPCFLDFRDGRAAQKARYGGEFFPSSFAANSIGNSFLEFFQLERYSGEKKGIVLVDLTADPMIHREVTT